MKRKYVHSHAKLPSPSALRMDRSAKPGWPTGSEQVPVVGQQVYSIAGMAEVSGVLGKTGDGSRLLVLRLLAVPAPPFHAAASNVLVSPDAAEDSHSSVLPTGRDWIS